MRSISGRFLARCGIAIVMVSLFMVFEAAPAAAQGTGASIIGRVTDESGAVLPGVTVTATSPALQVPQVMDVTNELGEYRLAPLPIGTFEVVYELSGFQPARRPEIRLTVGFAARVDVALMLATLTETVTVSGVAPVVDVTATTSSTLLTKQELELTPTSRNGLITLMSMAPGVRTILDVGGNNMTENPSGRVFGLSSEAWYTLEGIATTMIGGSGSGQFYDYQTVDEARVQTLGNDAEVATRGVQVNTIVKSGGNDFHGGFVWGQTGEKLQSENIDDELLALGITSTNAVATKYDFGGDLGGRIVRNKLWFYGAARRQGNELHAFGVGLRPDGQPARPSLKQTFLTGKVSYQMTPSQRFVGFFQQLEKYEVNEVNEYTAWEARGAPHNTPRFAKGEWEGVRGNNLIASALFGYRLYRSIDPFNSPGQVGRSDIFTQKVWGESFSAGDTRDEVRWEYKGALTWYKPNWAYGNHEFKAGVDYIPETTSRFQRQKGPDTVNYHLVYDNGAPLWLALMSSPTVPISTLHYLGAFIKDSWTIGRRVTLNVGLRFNHSNAFVNEQCRDAATPPSNIMFPARCFDKVQLAIWNNLAPRVHAAYDLTGDGRTVIKGGWGRFNHIREEPEMRRVNGNAIGVGVFRWRDLNGNNNYDAGEVNLDPQGPDFIASYGGPGTPYEAGVWSATSPGALADENLENPYQDEFSLGIERQIVGTFAVRATGLYSKYNNIYRLNNNLRPYDSYNIPITNQDPGPDGRLGTSDDGGMFTYWEYSTALQPRSFEQFMTITDPNGMFQTYKAFELAAIKRLSNRWQFMTSFSATLKDIPVGAGGPNGGALNPNAEINSRNKTWDRGAKVSGAYNMPYDVLTSVSYEFRSGDPFARQVQFRGGRTIPNFVMNVEPIGTRRLPNIHYTNLRAEKGFVLTGAHRVTVRVDLYNAFNINTATSLQPRSGAEFLRPREIMQPRIVEFGATYTF